LTLSYTQIILHYIFVNSSKTEEREYIAGKDHGETKIKKK